MEAWIETIGRVGTVLEDPDDAQVPPAPDKCVVS